MKCVLLIEPVSSGEKLIKKGKELGLKVIVLLNNKDERCTTNEFLQDADIVETVDMNNEQEAVHKAVEISKDNQIDAVLPGFEGFVPLAAKISAELGLKGLDPIFVEGVRLKHLMRQALEKHHLENPRFIVIKNQDDLQLAIDYVKFPCVIKPVDGAASINVKKVNSEKELFEAYQLIKDIEYYVDLGLKAKKIFIVEEYILGKEYSIEGFVDNKDIYFLSITEKLLGPEPYFVELGHIVSANLRTEIQQKIYKYVSKIVKILKISIGPFHCEIRLREGEPILMEIGARLAGGHICDLIFYATGSDLYEIMYNCYLGIPNSLKKIDKIRYAGIKFFSRPEFKFYTKIKGVEHIKNIQGFREIAFNLKEEAEIPASSNFSGRVGYAIFIKDSYQELRDILDEIGSYVQFQ